MAGPVKVKVWSKFSISKNAEKVNLKIVDVPRDRVKELADVTVKYFVKEEVSYKVMVGKDAEALMEYRDGITQLLSEAVYYATVCCVDEDDDKIGDFIGASMMMLSTNEDSIELKWKRLEALLKMFAFMDSLYEPMKIHSLERYYDGRGIFVRPDFRHNGIAQEFFRVRRLICKEHGVPMTGAWMTSYGTQKAAKRDGWEVKYELDRKELSQRYGVSFDSDSPPIMLFMVAKV